MPTLRIDPRKVKLHYSYTVKELSSHLGLCKQTILSWRDNGLEPIDRTRPMLFQGADIRRFIEAQSRARKRPCPAGTLYCFSCHRPRKPALGMVEYVAKSPASGNLRAFCEACELLMHRGVRKDEIDRVMPGLKVQMVEGPSRLSGKGHPSYKQALGS